jgi:hypothetical protein
MKIISGMRFMNVLLFFGMWVIRGEGNLKFVQGNGKLY